MKNTFITKTLSKCIVLLSMLAFGITILAGCKKYITVDTPPTSVSTQSAFKNNAAAIQFVTALYANMSGANGNGSYVSTSILPELSADNLSLYDKNMFRYTDYYKNSLEAQYLTSGEQDTYWVINYKQLYTINVAIEQLIENRYLTPAVAKRLLGEAYFMRAFYYFYLINFFGDVPLVLTSDYERNGSLSKTSQTESYKQIETDLSAAETLLDTKYVSADVLTTTAERLRPNLSAVNALQARVFLYQKKYTQAETAASKVIDQPAYALTDPASVFLKNSTETIWALQSVNVGYNTYEGSIFNLPPSGPNGNLFGGYPFFASSSLVGSFKPGDARKTEWLGVVKANNRDYYYPKKYKIPFIANSKDLQEYEIVLRLAELYLIRAEARNEQSNTIDAVSDLNALRVKRRETGSGTVENPLPDLSATLTQTQLRELILEERRHELFTEGGHRWFDLRRSGTIDKVMAIEEVEKGGTWESYKIYYPIPRYDLMSNKSLIQTPGYSN
ncbi:RagB/SusD family nutrient uptake outer membrane protein [Chitinophaga rhizophila]|uniref:RagB/SusD family nutrient uptake outer membrane protein n=1 Tax=Chitinophaga rhizophila TaxID=2866212 RepID=A0ABS7GHT1_9BACT|nr:RagB/SusD family nutrient uptake outer membrane protein [Chitinophaga rhizophila]MBW8687247.1 RagB/SusD family nutrient uptake outer membrane protein [Chitinophaga rhizophila]